jgi:Icc-related predicted phosphoesterase
MIIGLGELHLLDFRLRQRVDLRLLAEALQTRRDDEQLATIGHRHAHATSQVLPHSAKLPPRFPAASSLDLPREAASVRRAPSQMRLIFLADLHFSLKQYDWLVACAGDFDAVVIGGDLLDLASALNIDVQITVVEKYLGLLRKNTRVLAVSSGNHDGDSRNAADESVAQWLQDSRADRLHVDGDGFDLNGCRVTVCAWWDGDVTRAEVQSQLEREAAQVRGRWIWIYHAPPEGAHTCRTAHKSIGDAFLHQWIEKFQPDMVLSGHIHNAPFVEGGSWIDRIGRTWVFNTGRQPGAEPTSIVIDLDTMTAEWKSAWDRAVRSLADVNA